MITELNTWDSFSPGRLDQHLYPVLRARPRRRHADARAGARTARVLLGEVQQPAGAAQGGRHGGRERHLHRFLQHQHRRPQARTASDGVNDVTYLILEVIDEMRLLQPSSNLQLSKKNPDRFLKRGLEIVRKGWGQPSIFNADMVVEELLRQGKSIEDARARRHQRLRGDGRVRQGSLHPDRLLQPAEGARDYAEQRVRSAHRQADRHRDRRPAPRSPHTTSCSRRSAGSCATSSTSRFAATT